MVLKNLFYVFVFIVSVALVIFSLYSQDISYAMIAEVDSQKTAISFPKPVRIKALHIQPGQHVKAGDVLIEVERPDLLLDIEKIRNEQNILEASIQKLHMDYTTSEHVSSLKHRQQIANIDGKIMELESRYASESLFYSEVSEWAGVDSVVTEQTLVDIQRTNLSEERKLEVRRFVAEKAREKVLYNNDNESFQLKKQLLEAKMKSFMDEQKALVQYAAFDGTIGAVSVQLMELVPPYQTIISVYDANPNMIKAYLNEQAKIIPQVGDKVEVESFNRTYKIEGEIIEIGSRIVSYPKQMIPLGQLEMWGKEVFVRIPEQNRFLNGEKVYVIINP